MPPSSNSYNDKKVIKRLEKQSDRHLKEISQHRASINNMKVINRSLLDENKFLKDYIRDMERQNTNARQNNTTKIHKLNTDIDDLNNKNSDNIAKLNNITKLNNKLKTTINNNFKKITKLEGDKDTMQQNYNILETKYNELLYQHRCFLRDLEKDLEECQPLLSSIDNPCLYQMDKLEKHNLANFKFAKKIENKNSNKDNISFLYKPMSKSSNGGFPTLFSELQNFLNVPPTTSRCDNNQKKYVDEVQAINKKIVNENQSLRNERYKLQNNVTYLNSQLNMRESECENLRNKMEEIKTKLQNLQTNDNKKSELVSAMLGVSNEHENEKSKQYEILQQEYQKLNMQYKMLVNEHTNVTSKYNKMLVSQQDELHVANEVQQLKEQITDLEKWSESLEKDNTELLGNKSNLMRMLDEYKQQLSAQDKLLMENNDNQKTRVSSYESLIEELNTKITNLGDYKNKYNELAKKLEAREENYVKEMNDMVQTFKNCGDIKTKLDNVNLQKTIKIKEDELKSLKSKSLKVMNDDIRTKLDNVNHQKAITIKQIELESLRQAICTQELIELQFENDSKTNEIEELEFKLNGTIDKLNELKDKYDTQSNDLDILIEQHDETVDELNELKEKYETQSNDLDVLIEQHDELLTNYDSVLKTNDESKNVAKVNESIEQEVKGLKSLIDELCTENETYHSENFELKNKVATLTAKCERYIGTIQDLDDENEETQLLTENQSKEIESLKNKVTTLQTDADILKNQKATLANLVEKMTREAEDNKNNYVGYGEFAALEDDYKCIYNKYVDSQNMVNELDAKLLKLENEVQTQKQEFENKMLSLKNANKSLYEEMQNTEESYGKLQQKYKQLIADDETMMKQIEQLQNNKDSLEEILSLRESEINKYNEYWNKIVNNLDTKLNETNEQWAQKLQEVKIASMDKETTKKQQIEQLQTKYEALDEKYHQLVIENGEMAQQISEMKPLYDRVNKSTEGWDVIDASETL